MKSEGTSMNLLAMNGWLMLGVLHFTNKNIFNVTCKVQISYTTFHHFLILND